MNLPLSSRKRSSSRRRPRVSFVLATYNRQEVIERTLRQLSDPAVVGLSRGQYEIIVVDNASRDGTADAAAGAADCVLRLRSNLGSCGKALGVERVTAPLVVFLDDDSYPQPGSIERMIERFAADPDLVAAGFAVHLPDGREEGGALPGIPVGCGVGYRTAALRGVGGLDRTFFMQAEEYDLSFRLAGAGGGVEVFDDLHVDHLKTTQARKNARTTFFDIRNNLRVVSRYLPDPHYLIYRQDWRQRYGWLARCNGNSWAYRRGLGVGLARGAYERWTRRKWRLSPDTLERFFCWRSIRARLMDLRRQGVQRVLLADLGKNVYPYHAGARAAGIEVLALADDRFAAPGRCYRGTRILPVTKALTLPAEVVVVSNTSWVHAVPTRERLRLLTDLPVHDWFGRPANADSPENPAETPASSADELVEAACPRASEL